MLVAQHPSRLDTCRDHRTCYVIRRFGLGFRSVHDGDASGGQRGERGIDGIDLIQQFRALGVQRPQRALKIDRHHSVAASFAAYAACFSLRAAFRVCHDLCSVFGFAFSRFFDSRVGGVVVEAI
ncbi:MAG: hypothetical protein DMD76_30925 [Candidatus Rokuibacteriota bacterium]|nr:MAG: hypothetical protein DMD76_30925 [Candidatus Rokubacteria bacterium]